MASSSSTAPEEAVAPATAGALLGCLHPVPSQSRPPPAVSAGSGGRPSVSGEAEALASLLEELSLPLALCPCPVEPQATAEGARCV